jgi:hypothetical protein
MAFSSLRVIGGALLGEIHPARNGRRLHFARRPLYYPGSVASPSSGKNKVALAALGVLLALVIGVGFTRLSRQTVPELPPAAPPTAKASATAAASPASPAARPPDAGAAPSSETGARPVYLRIEGVRLVRPAAPGAHPRIRVRAEINATHFDYPSQQGDAGAQKWVEVEVNSKMSPEHYAITRSYYYEVYFEAELRGGGAKLSGVSSTLNLTSKTISDKLPFHAEYPLYATGHGLKAAEPTAVLTYSITDTP